jgi:S-adenosylmethionine synthetase
VNLILEQIGDPPPGERALEIVERKGLGHPDTICDALAEEVSRALSRWYLDRFGRVLHHNVDKALLCGGASSPRFGGGEVTQPIELILGGRATAHVGGVDVPVEALAIESCRAWLRRHLHALDVDRHVRITSRLRPGSGDLVDLFGRQGRATLANDTSIGVGFAPLSRLESTVLDVEAWINGPAAKRERPETGEDVKVMAVRAGERTSLTVSCAFVSRYVASAAEYLTKKERLVESIRRNVLGDGRDPIEISVNAADDPGAESLYLTVTGTSAEAGDDGEVGRGNRANGLITPGRPMTLEAAAGKNPVSHVGKLYNVLAGAIARDLVGALPDVRGAECVLVSRIGAPIDEPQAVSIRLRTVEGSSPKGAAATEEIVRDHLHRLASLSDALIAGQARLY